MTLRESKAPSKIGLIVVTHRNATGRFASPSSTIRIEAPRGAGPTRTTFQPLKVDLKLKLTAAT